jgi:hypothetical protein
MWVTAIPSKLSSLSPKNFDMPIFVLAVWYVVQPAEYNTRTHEVLESSITAQLWIHMLH